jgi:hypothetical protein
MTFQLRIRLFEFVSVPYAKRHDVTGERLGSSVRAAVTSKRAGAKANIN